MICADGKFNKIIFTNFTANGNVSEISIKDKVTNEDILYSLSGNFEGIPERIDDGNFSKNSIDITSDTILILDFDQEYNMNSINIYMYLTDNGLEVDTFKMTFLKDRYPISEKTLVIETIISTCFATKCKMTINHDSSWSNQTEFIEKYYRYRDKLFKYYDIERTYLDGYFTTFDGYIKDETQSKTFYRYKEQYITNIPKTKNKKDKTISTYYKKTEEKKDKSNVIDKVEVFKPKEKKANKNNYFFIKIVTLGLILSFIFVIGRILYKKKILSRTI